MIATVAVIGRIIGKIIFQNAVISEAPSIAAASSISLGIFEIKPWYKNVDIAVPKPM